MNLKTTRIIAVTLTAFVTACSSWAGALTNADVLKMVQANLDQSIIVTAIQNSEPKFDTSPQGLIDLSAAKVPQEIVSAMIKRGAAPTAAVTPPTTDRMAPSEILMMDGEKSVSMRYLNPQVRTAARGLGFGGIASYAVLRNSAAAMRTKNREPSFLVSVPNQAQVESYLTLASFAVRRNNSREVMIGGGYMSYSTGVHPDRVMPVSTEKVDDQHRAQQGFTIYKVSPKNRLPPGEYAMILYTGETQSMVAGWFTGTGNSYFDFGIDP